ncbi:MAG: S1 RNA-binding domain-containing protein [Parcubacteria group bacterium]|nr:S1 RNA-binding domain-containing protein [Parcubacteria group bacterium]
MTNTDVENTAEILAAPEAGAVKEKSAEKTTEGMSMMDKYMLELPKLPEDGDLVEGPVVGIEKAALYADLGPFGTGIIYGREFLTARDIIKKVNIGDIITAKVVLKENEDGYVELSLKEAHQAIIWNEAEELMKNKTVLRIPVKDANKGGLIIEWKGLQGFLPASQLGTEHYPRVEDGDKGKIMEELKKLVNQKVAVSILAAVPKEGKLIFTEKGNDQKEREVIVERYAVGDEVTGEITGIVDFGVFIKIEDGLEGLVHISELDWGLVEDPRRMFKVGEKVRAKVIEITNGKISLSIKALKENPWVSAKERYKKGDTVKGVIIKYNKYGALASIEEGVAGLVHLSEFGTEDKLKSALELGKTYTFKISHFDSKDQKMALSFKTAPAGESAKEEI